MKKAVKIVLVLLASVLLLLVMLIQPIDRTPYPDTGHYAAWKEQLDEIDLLETKGQLQASWAKVNITPNEPAPMGGYGHRWGKHFEEVHDSLFVRVIALRNPFTTIYFLSADMLIMPPNVTQRLGELLEDEGIALSDIHFGATHTHHGLGEWGQKLAGRLFSGKYKVETEIRLAQQFKEAILGASLNWSNTEVAYSEHINLENIRYRLGVDDGVVDPWIRSLIFRRDDGREAKLLTYGAHATLLPARLMYLSRDFPGVLVDSLELQGLDFAMYMSGAVGSMGAKADGETPFERIDNMTKGILEHIDDRESVPLEEILMSRYIEIPMPKPSVRIHKSLALRPWVFRAFFGEQSNQLRISKIGKVLLIGVPADFSGEIMQELDAYADARGLELMITSFSGGYIGYVTPDKMYGYDVEETRIMSWNGYQFGGYLTEVIRDIIDKVLE